MYQVSIFEAIIFDIVTNMMMMILYTRLLSKKMILKFILFAVVAGLVTPFVGDLAQILMLILYLGQHLFTRHKIISFNTIAFVSVLCVDMVLAEESTFLAHHVYNPNYSAVVALLVNIFLYILAIHFLSFVKGPINKFRNSPLTTKKLISTVINFILIVFISLQTINFAADILENAIELQWLIIMLMIFFISSTMAVMFYFVKSSWMYLKEKNEKQQRQFLEKYTANLEENYTQLRKFKHDYQNILLSMGEYIIEDDREGLKEYYEKIVLKTGQEIMSDNMRFDGLENIKVPAIRSLTYQKLVKAQQLGIETNLEVRDPFSKVAVDIITVVRILGILLDNAIEATADQNKGIISIAYVVQSDGDLEVIVQNTVKNDNQVELNKIFEDGYTTKGNGHGKGLSNVKKLVDETPNTTLEIRIVGGQYRTIIGFMGVN